VNRSSGEQAVPVFERLDFIYMPSADVAADLDRYVSGLGAEPVFAIEAFDARVAAVRLGEGHPMLVLADHLGGEAPILVFRTAAIDATLARLAERGIEAEARFEIPPGPCATLNAGGQRIAVYERTRAVVEERLTGRFDFGPLSDG
jgi:hypothetical protein